MRLRIINDSTRSSEELEALVRSVLELVEAVGGIRGSVAVRFRRGKGRYAYGHAATRDVHGLPRLAGRATHYVSVAVPTTDDGYGRARICGHASGKRRPGAPSLDELYDAGVRKVGRWPLTREVDWREDTLGTIAHEFFHVIQFDRRRARLSEVECEVFAARALDAYRAAKSPRAT